PLARPHSVGWTPTSGGRFGAGPLPVSARWLMLCFIPGAVLAYCQRPYPPSPATRSRASHAARSGGGRRWHAHDTHAIVRRPPLPGPDPVIPASPEGPPAHLHVARGVAGLRRSGRCRQRLSDLPYGEAGRVVVPPT